jgi:hypothetical protein
MSPDETPNSRCVEHGERIRSLEFIVNSHSERLNHGAESISSLRSKLTLSGWKVVALFIGLLVPSMSVIWTFAQYPERAEFRSVEATVNKVQLEQATMKTEVTNLKDMFKELKIEIRSNTEAILVQLDKLNKKR